MSVDPDAIVCPAGCGRAVREVTTTAGATLLVDPAPHEQGSIVADTDGRYRVLPGAQLPAGQAAYRPHAQTCMAELRNRRRAWNRAPAAPRDVGPPCWTCHMPLDGFLARLGQTTHPSCDTGAAS